MATDPFEVITFDCYGTLIDWRRGLRDAFAAEAFRSGTTFDGDAVVAAYHAIEPEVQDGPYRSYRAILGETARRVGEEFSWPIGPRDETFLARSLPGWPPFEDTGPALERLSRAGLRLGILSNIDDDLLEGTRRLLPDVFDPALIVTAQQVGSYKPSPGHFAEASRRIGGRRWLHAAQSAFHDIRPASERGIATAWVNRRREPLPEGCPPPRLGVPSMADLADALLGP